jgi:hypothetical protein
MIVTITLLLKEINGITDGNCIAMQVNMPTWPSIQIILQSKNIQKDVLTRHSDTIGLLQCAMPLLSLMFLLTKALRHFVTAG